VNLRADGAGPSGRFASRSVGSAQYCSLFNHAPGPPSGGVRDRARSARLAVNQALTRAVLMMGQCRLPTRADLARSAF
jgi:hypothetical protein